MKRAFSKVLGIKKPVDGYTDEEKLIVDLLCNSVVEEIYQKMPTSRMKAIVAMHFELGYDTYTLANIFGVTQPQIALDIRNIKKVLLGQPYKPQKQKPTMKYDAQDLLWFITQLHEK